MLFQCGASLADEWPPLNQPWVLTMNNNILLSAIQIKFPAVWECLGVDPLDMTRTPYLASEGKRSQ